MQALSLSPMFYLMLSDHMTPNLGRAARLGGDIIVVNELEMLLWGCSCARGPRRYPLQHRHMSAIMMCRCGRR